MNNLYEFLFKKSMNRDDNFCILQADLSLV